MAADIFLVCGCPRQRTFAVVDLRFLPGIRLKPATDFFGSAGRSLPTKRFDRVVRAVVAVMLDQILIDRDRVTALGGLRLDKAPMRLAGAARRRQGLVPATSGTLCSSAANWWAMRRIVAR